MSAFLLADELINDFFYVAEALFRETVLSSNKRDIDCFFLELTFSRYTFVREQQIHIRTNSFRKRVTCFGVEPTETKDLSFNILFHETVYREMETAIGCFKRLRTADDFERVDVLNELYAIIFLND